jgi:uncharacterized protein
MWLPYPHLLINCCLRRILLPEIISVNLENPFFMRWRRFNGEHIHLPIKEEVKQAIIRETDKGYHLKVCIGTDSQVKGHETEFATVIVFLREGHGGFMFIHNEKTRQAYSIKERMLVEVAKSIEIAYELCDLFTEYDVDMEVHADINTMKPFVKPWVISLVWALPSRPNLKLLPAAVALTKL